MRRFLRQHAFQVRARRGHRHFRVTQIVGQVVALDRIAADFPADAFDAILQRAQLLLGLAGAGGQGRTARQPMRPKAAESGRGR